MNSIIEAQITFEEWQHNFQLSSNGEPLLYNDKLCYCAYSNEDKSLFQCDDKGYILDKTNKILYQLTDIGYINLLLKIDTVERQYDKEKPSIIKNVQI
jgi:hypothetical protein